MYLGLTVLRTYGLKTSDPYKMLFNNSRKASHLHYGTAKKARQTLKYLRTRPRGEQIRSAQSMFFRAKYHANQTKDMREAMKVYGDFVKTIKHKE